MTKAKTRRITYHFPRGAFGLAVLTDIEDEGHIPIRAVQVGDALIVHPAVEATLYRYISDAEKWWGSRRKAPTRFWHVAQKVSGKKVNRRAFCKQREAIRFAVAIDELGDWSQATFASIAGEPDEKKQQKLYERIIGIERDSREDKPEYGMF